MLHTLDVSTWSDPILPEQARLATEALEKGNILYFPGLPFHVSHEEKRLLSPCVLAGNSKNVCFDPRTQSLKRTACTGERARALQEFMARFADNSVALCQSVLPHYQSGLEQGRTSFRPVEVKGRKSSSVKDDTRLHVDAFPSAPNAGKRIIRVFTNVNPYHQNRQWAVGEPFDEVVSRFYTRFRNPVVGLRSLLSWLGITKSYRTLYDHYMLTLHDTMKLDVDYQNTVAKTQVEFPPGATWMVMTDQVSHAALRGQFILEQTFYLPVECMLQPSRSPLRVLEKVLGKALVA